jgi:hypothetical protein
MKKQYLIILLVALVGLKVQAQTNASMPTDSTVHIGLSAYAQSVSLTPVNATSPQEYQHYLRTAKTLRVLGWTSFVGIPVMVYGLGMAIGSIDGSSNGGLGVVLMGVGSVLTLSTIPLFIVSHHYKKKGNKLKVVSVSLGSQQVFVPQGNRFTSSVQPALSVKVSL